MFNRIWASKIAQVAILSLLIAAPLSALDVVYLKNGDIIIGTIQGAVDGGISYQSFGESRTIPSASISATEKNLEGLSVKTVRIVLKDGSTIQGTIVDYDDEIGIFLDISFGTLTIPVTAVARIYDLETFTRYAGTSSQIAVYGGVYFPLGTSADAFGMSWLASASADWAIPSIRGLYLGARFTFYGMDFTANPDVRYFMASIRPELSYKYLGWRMKEGFMAKLVPYITLGSGPSYISINNPAETPAEYGNITAEIALAAGLELTLSKNFITKLEGNALAVLQDGIPFLSAGAMLSICFER